MLQARAGSPLCSVPDVLGPPCLSTNVGLTRPHMALARHSWWWWTREALAAVLAALLLGMALPEAVKIVVDRSTDPPTREVIWGTNLESVGAALISLACIYVSMWKRWEFEIFGWLLLIMSILFQVFG